MAAVSVASHQWPFTRAAILKSLQQQANSEIEIKSFRQTFFPKPGCVAEGIVFRRPGDRNGSPFLTIQRLEVLSTYHGLLANHVSLIKVVAFHVIVTPQQEAAPGGALHFNVGSITSGLTIGKIIADGAFVEFAPTAKRKQPLIFRVPKLVVHDLAEGKSLSFLGTVQIPQPAATVEITGEFGPWRSGLGGQSKMSGSYELKSLDLGTFSAIGGMVTSTGTYSGILQHVVVNGSVDTPNFTVSTSGHRIHINGDFEATVNGLNGDVDLDAAQVRYGKTTIVGAGSVAGQPGINGKVATFELSSKQARVQDLLWMFISEKTPPMTGPITFRAKVTIPPGKQPFLNRVLLQGDFGISNAQYPNSETQKEVDVLSARGQGKADRVEDMDQKMGSDAYDPGRVMSDIKGHVVLRNTVAHLSDTSFAVPGASTKVNGTYELESEKIDLQGYMHLESQLDKTTTGVKSFLLKVIQPFMKKGKRDESVVWIKIGGTYQNPSYAVVPKAAK